MKLVSIPVFVIGLLLAVSQGCTESAQTQSPDGSDSTVRYRIVTTVGMVTDIARRVAGERASVQGVIPSGTDPHLFLASRADVSRIMNADIVFYSGLMLEGRMTDIFTRAASGGKPVYAVTELIEPSYLLEPPEFAGHPDPHVWMDPTAWARAVEAVRDRLIAYDPDGQDEYASNAADMLEDISRLSAYAEAVLASVPEHQRVLVTAHDAFNYFGRRFGFEVLGIQGISTDSEAGVRDIERLVSVLVDKRIPAVFVESTVAERNVRALVDGARAQGQAVVIGGSLYSDAMGADGTWAGTYIGMIDHNVTTIARALGGIAPENGMRSWKGEGP